MILIYLNYRLWSIKLKVIYAKVLDTLVMERNGNTLNCSGGTIQPDQNMMAPELSGIHMNSSFEVAIDGMPSYFGRAVAHNNFRAVLCFS